MLMRSAVEAASVYIGDVVPARSGGVCPLLAALGRVAGLPDCVLEQCLGTTERAEAAPCAGWHCPNGAGPSRPFEAGGRFGQRLVQMLERLVGSGVALTAEDVAPARSGARPNQVTHATSRRAARLAADPRDA